MFSDFRQIATPNEAGKSEKLFRAAISAFCSITRPTRREVAQLEDLVLPLFDSVSADSRRYVARARGEGVDATVHVWEGMPHVFPANVGTLEAAERALETMAVFLQERLGSDLK